jgi:hypothetical protein
LSNLLPHHLQYKDAGKEYAILAIQITRFHLAN